MVAYHSFGTYIVTTYLHLFPSKRIIGMIDLGGLPLRFTKEIQGLTASIDPFSLEQIEEMKNEIYSIYKTELTAKLKAGDQSVNSNILENK